MQENQKMGFSIILGAVVFIIFAFMISDDLGSPDIGFYQRFMRSYFVYLFEKEHCLESECYAISFHTKWAVFAGICIAAYGLTVYRGIARFPPWKK